MENKTKNIITTIITIIVLVLFIAYAGVWGLVSYLAFVFLFAGWIIYKRWDMFKDVVQYGAYTLLDLEQKARGRKWKRKKTNSKQN